jgi:hypothetical protein
MKHIFKWMMLPALMLPLVFCSCDDDRDSNPTLDTSKASEGFVLNVPANAANNTYDLANASGVHLTCHQPNYGGVPYVTRYYVQVAIDEAFLTDTTVAHKELPSSYTNAEMSVASSELNDSIVALFKDENPDLNYPEETRPVYIRLRAVIDNTRTGLSYSNIITLPKVLARYVAPKATYPKQLFVIGSSIQTAWSSWKSAAPVYDVDGQFYTMVYFPAGAEFKWGLANGDYRGFSRIKTINDKAGAGITAADEDNIKVANAGWYVLHFVTDIVDNALQFTLNVHPGAAYIIGNTTGDWTDGYAASALTAPADGSGEWVSPAFTSAGELRAYVKVPGIEWYHTEFTLYKGAIFWRNLNIISNWAENAGADYSVACEPGQKLYVNFDQNTAEVK